MKRFVLTFMLCLLGFVNPMRAQETVTIGSGTERSGMIPVDFYNPYGLNQQIYLADEIGKDAGYINGISLKPCTFGSSIIQPSSSSFSAKLFLV